MSKSIKNSKLNIFIHQVICNAIYLLLPLFSVLVLGPLELYVANMNEFYFQLYDFLFVFILVFCIALIIGGIILNVIPKPFRTFICRICAIVGICMYIQYLFLNGKMSNVDGSRFNWDEHKMYTIINLVIWCAIFVIFTILLKYKKITDEILVKIAGIMVLIELITTIIILIKILPQKYTNHSYQLSGQKAMQIAPNDNIFILVLDSYGNVQFENCLKEDPELIVGLEDFVYYKNADCSFYGTFPSMSAMITGTPYNGETQYEYQNKAWNSNKTKSFFEQLKSNNYVFRIYSEDARYVYGDLCNLSGKIDNVEYMKNKIDYFSLYRKMFKYSMFKYSPQIVKPLLELSTQDFDCIVDYQYKFNDDNLTYYNDLRATGLSIDDNIDNGIFLTHIGGAHSGYTLTSDMRNEEGIEFIETARGLHTIVLEYLDQIKKLGKYDSSTIIIMADHGPRVFNEQYDMQPILFVKRPYENHEMMNISEAPVSSMDFQATILYLCGINSESESKTIFDIPEDEMRERVLWTTGINGIDDYIVISYKGNRNDLFNLIKKNKYVIKKKPAIDWKKF